MNTETQLPKRQYASRLRAQQANETRIRILEALAEQLADEGLKDISIDQIALRAGVSTRTVYHHFPNREDLFDSLNAWLDEQAIGSPIPGEPSAEELFAHIRAAFEVFDEKESWIRAQLINELGQVVRKRGRSRRRAAIEAMVLREVPGLSPPAMRRATALIHYLTSSEAWRSMKDESGMSGREAGEAVVWAIETLLSRLRSSQQPSGTSEERQRE